jgi:hypothetical protein
MSKFKELVSEYALIGVISPQSEKTLNERYDKLLEEKRLIYDKHPKLVIDNFLNRFGGKKLISTNVESIAKNVRFFAWLIIIGLIVQFVVVVTLMDAL